MQNIIHTFTSLSGPLLYLVIGIAIIMFFPLLVKIFKGARKMGKVLMAKPYAKNPDAPSLTSAQQTAINIGAINAEQTLYYANSLATGDTVKNLQENLYNYYEINPEDGLATEVLDWALTEGHRKYFDAMKQDFANLQPQAWMPKAQESFEGEELEKCIEFMNNLEECVSILIEEGYINSRQELGNISIAAWDFGRLVNITRGCFDSSYVSEENAWKYINNAYEESKSIYNGWKDFAQGYVIGRAMWGGESISLDGIMTISKSLLEDDESPWKLFPLK